MSDELSDALLDILWDWHLAGRQLPSELSVETTDLGPEIWLRLPQAAYRFRKGQTPKKGATWKTSPVLQ